MSFTQDALKLRRNYLAGNKAMRKLFTRIVASMITLFAIMLGLAVVSAPDVKDDGARLQANDGNSTQASASLGQQDRSAQIDSRDRAGR